MDLEQIKFPISTLKVAILCVGAIKCCKYVEMAHMVQQTKHILYVTNTNELVFIFTIQY